MADMNTLIGFRRDRMGGRLANLLYTWRLAKKLGCRAVIFWPKPVKGMEEFYGEGYEIGKFLDILKTYSDNHDNDLWIIDSEPGDLSVYPSLLDDPFLRERNRGGVDAGAMFSGSSTVVYNGYVLITMKNEDRAAAKREIPDLLARLAPNPAVAAAYKRLLRLCKPRAMYAVHYRRGDITHFLRRTFEDLNGIEHRRAAIVKHTSFWLRKCAPFQSYVSYINDNVKPGYKIAVFSDEPTAAVNFAAAFGADRVFTSQTLESTMLPIQYVFMEMMFMANCRGIVSTKSGFSEMPAIMGGKTIINIQKYCSLEQIADDYLDVTRLDQRTVLPEIVLEIFAAQGVAHYRKMFKRTWTEDDFRKALTARWTARSAFARSAHVA